MPKSLDPLIPLTVRFPESVIKDARKAARKSKRPVNSEYVIRMERSLSDSASLGSKLDRIIEQNTELLKMLDQVLDQE